MRRILAALVLALSSAAWAQSVKIEMNPGKMGFEVKDEEDAPAANANIQVGPGAVSVTSKSVEERSEDGYKLRYESHPQGNTLIKVLAPEGAHVDIYEGQQRVASDDIPTSVPARADAFYRFVIRVGNATWEKKLAAKGGMTLSLWVAAPAAPVVVQPAPAPVVVVQPAPPPPPQPAGPVAMSAPSFSELLEAIEEEGFPDDKVGVLRTAVANSSAWFTCDQVGQLIDAFAFPENKLQALGLVKDRIVDRANAFKISSHFAFPDDKKKAQAMLR